MAKIKVDKHNARLHPERNQEAVNKSLAELGAGRSIVADADGVIIGGNAVYEEAKKLGIPVKEIETKGNELIVVRRVDLATDDPRRKALAIADNRSTDLSQWDFPKLEGLLDELKLEDIDLSVTGFGPDELALLLAENTPFEGEDFGEGEESPELPTEPRFVVYLSFDAEEKATAWLVSVGLEKYSFKSGANTIVINMK